MSKFNEENFLKALENSTHVRDRNYTRTSWPKKTQVAITLKPLGTVQDSTTDFYEGLAEFLSGFYPNDQAKVSDIVETFRSEQASNLCALSREDMLDLQNQFKYTL